MTGAAVMLAAGGGAPIVDAPNVSDVQTPGAAASLTWQNDGTIDASSPANIDAWLIPAIAAFASAYEIKFEQSAGDALDSGTLSSWISLGTGHSLAYTLGGPGAKAGNGTYIIRRASDMVELDNGTWNLECAFA